MIITAITPQKKRDRLNIFLDGKFAFSLSPEQVVISKLKINQELTQKEVDQLIKESEFSKWYNQILRLLSFRPRSVKEVTDYIKRKQVGESTLALILQKLKSNNLLNDHEFSKWFIEQRLTFRPKAKRLLRMELGQKGVDKETIDDVFGSLNSEISEVDTASKLIQKKAYQWKKLNEIERRKKIQGYLARRGFDWETIKEILKTSPDIDESS